MPKFTKSIEVELTIDELAEAFSDLSGEDQAGFLKKVVSIAGSWGGDAGTQWHYMGTHLRIHSARHAVEMLRSILESATQE